ncbi:MAG: DUF86 domain-containing protein [Spirochaetales bacterium]|nr:DUF86 domain-containing protein [Spirochaetales bacterium]
MQRDIKTYCSDILESIDKIGKFIEDMSFQKYTENSLVKSAVERQFEIIGESLSRISRYFPQKFSEISNGRNIIDFRNIISHGYDVIEDSIVWDIIKNHLPGLEKEMNNLLNSE